MQTINDVNEIINRKVIEREIRNQRDAFLDSYVVLTACCNNDHMRSFFCEKKELAANVTSDPVFVDIYLGAVGMTFKEWDSLDQTERERLIMDADRNTRDYRIHIVSQRSLREGIRY